MLIFHTSDIHGRLTYKKAVKILKFKEKGAILLDSGDSLSAGNLDVRLKEKTLYYMTQVGYAAGVIGNREFHPIPFFFKFKLKDANFPFLSANLMTKKEIDKVIPYLFLNIDKYCIALVGLTVPIIKESWRKFFPLVFFDPILCGEKILSQFSEKVDLVIFLTHMGINRDIELAKKIKRRCFILGGHSHIWMDEVLKVNDCFIVHSGYYAESASLVEIERNKVKIKREKL